mmetsp:Transcript_21491/g.37990  ORF Transcript_21491/g.37990 Transcript_21491/m.37990 type:complete len:118 (-) Transcript_21491:2021-2374(-)
MGRLEKLDLALARLIRSDQPSKSKVEAAATAAIKLHDQSEDVVNRLAGFFDENGADGKLTAFYVLGAVLDLERKKLKTRYLADLFEKRMKGLIEKFRTSPEKERKQVSKVLGRWAKK